MDYMLWIWVGVVALAMIIEAMSMDMTSIWFAVAGIISIIVWAIDSNAIVWQLVVFVVVSTLCIVFLRRITKKLIQKPTVATNSDVLIGKKAVLVDEITENELGSVKINGIVWSVKAENDEAIASGSEVEITKIDGNKLIVKKVKVAPVAESQE